MTQNDEGPQSVGSAFPGEQARIRDLIVTYKDLPNGAGTFGAIMLEDTLRRADEATASGDVIAIVQSYEEMVKCN